MKVIVDLSVIPLGVDIGMSPYIAACERVLQERGLKSQLHANGTAIEGEWEPVFQAVEACHRTIHDLGCGRVFSVIKVNTRTDRDQSLEDRVASVEARLR